jgi:hypothetical protein
VTRRTPLVAGGFLVGALIGALPPMQVLPLRWNCVASGGYWVAEAQACGYRASRPFAVPALPPGRERNLLNEEER